MTAPATDKNTGNKTPAKNTPAKAENKVETPVSTEAATTETEAPKDRIPSVLQENPILVGFCKQYLEVVDAIAEYNKQVLADKDSEWNAQKVINKARELGNPEDPAKADAEIKKLLDSWEDLVAKAANARKAVLDATSKKLGISLSAVADKDAEKEAALKEKRKLANEIGTQLLTIAKLSTDAKAGSAVNEFLQANPLLAVGRDQARNFTDEGKSTPKYRVRIKVEKDGNVLLEEDGFTKTALGLTKPAFGYDRGKAPKADDLRKAWENAGNSAEKTVKENVVFEDNGLTYTITKK